MHPVPHTSGTRTKSRIPKKRTHTYITCVAGQPSHSIKYCTLPEIETRRPLMTNRSPLRIRWAAPKYKFSDDWRSLPVVADVAAATAGTT